MASNNPPSDLSLYLKKINRYPLLLPGEEIMLARQYRNGDLDAGQKIINANLRFVVRVCKSYFYHGHDPVEIIQEGNLGLIKALTRFDPERGVNFICYAIWWIRAYVKDFVYKKTKVRTGMLGYAKGLVSLDRNLSDKEGSEDKFIDYLPDIAPSQEDSYFSKQKKCIITDILHSDFGPLNVREKYIINRRFFDEPTATLKEISQTLGITRERVRQIQVRSLAKIREYIEKQQLVKRIDLNLENDCHMLGKRIFPSSSLY